MPLLNLINAQAAKFLGVVIVIQFCKCVNCVKLCLEEIVKVVSIHIQEGSTDDRAMHNKNSRKCPTDEGSQSLGAQQINMYNIKEEFPGRLGIPHFINLNLISYKHTELHNIMLCRKIYSKIYDSVLLINSTYGIPISVEYMSDFSALISSVYFINLSVHEPTENFSDANTTAVITPCVGISLIMLSTIMYVSLTCHLANLECKKIRDIIEKRLLRRSIKKNVFQGLHLFSNPVSNNRIEFMAFLFFVIDIKMFVTFIA